LQQQQQRCENSVLENFNPCGRGFVKGLSSSIRMVSCTCFLRRRGIEIFENRVFVSALLLLQAKGLYGWQRIAIWCAIRP